MIAYRSTLDGGSGKLGDYTITTINNGVKTILPSMAPRLENISGAANIVVGSNIFLTSYMMIDSPNFSGDIYFKGNRWRNLLVNRLLYNCYDNRIKNIHFHPNLNNLFNGTTANSSLIGRTITWSSFSSDLGYGFMNSAYNIYCFNDYFDA